ncbi:hypothetical protein B8W95_13015, partial [Staphylococcus pasteuri]
EVEVPVQVDQVAEVGRAGTSALVRDRGEGLGDSAVQGTRVVGRDKGGREVVQLCEGGGGVLLARPGSPPVDAGDSPARRGDGAHRARESVRVRSAVK